MVPRRVPRSSRSVEPAAGWRTRRESAEMAPGSLGSSDSVRRYARPSPCHTVQEPSPPATSRRSSVSSPPSTLRLRGTGGSGARAETELEAAAVTECISKLRTRIVTKSPDDDPAYRYSRSCEKASAVTCRETAVVASSDERDPPAGSRVQYLRKPSPPVASWSCIVSRRLTSFLRPPQQAQVAAALFLPARALATMQPETRSHTTILPSFFTPTVRRKRSSSEKRTSCTPWSCSCRR
mmetsp:Transcript_22202/g.73679  ORF Transcript_22202/g.73679 Transcript_22202/m.73679 type:complete len:238 (+) Transcript_22202:1262-1975(+)